jgi:hypothetical protein
MLATAAVWWLADAQGGSAALPPEISTVLSLLQIPVVGVVIVGLHRGWLVTGKEHDRVVRERDRERDERVAAQAALTHEVVPLLTVVQATSERVIRVLDERSDRR